MGFISAENVNSKRRRFIPVDAMPAAPSFVDRLESTAQNAWHAMQGAASQVADQGSYLLERAGEAAVPLLQQAAAEAVPTDASGALQSGAIGSLAGMAHTGAAAARRSEDVLKALEPPMPTPRGRLSASGITAPSLQKLNLLAGEIATRLGIDADSGLDLVADWFERQYGRLAQTAMEKMPVDATTADKVLAGLGSAPAMLVEAGAATAAGGVPGLVGLMALKGSTNPETGEFTGVADTLRGGAEGLAMAYGLHKAGAAPTVVGKVARGAPVGALLAAKHGGGVSDIVAESTVMGALAGLGGGGKVAGKGEVRAPMETQPEPARSAQSENLSNRTEAGPIFAERPVATQSTSTRRFIPASEAKVGDVQAMAAPSVPGESYVGLIGGTLERQSTEAKPKAPLRREKILRDFATDLETTFYSGHMEAQPNSRVGFFRQKVEEIRTRKHADLEITAHEAAHLLEARYPEITEAYKSNPIIDRELRSVSYDASKVSEGWAEFMRLWMTQPATASRVAPRTEAFLGELMARDADLSKALNKARGGMSEWFAQDALTRAQSKMGPTVLDLTSPVKRLDWMQQRMFDDLHALKVAEQSLRGELQSAEKSAYKTARLMRAKHDVAAKTLKFGHPTRQADGSVKYEGKGLNAILSPFEQKGELKSFLQYMVGRRAAELKERGKENLFTDEEIHAMLALEKPGYREGSDEYQAFNRGLVRFAVDSGVISSDAAEAMSRYFYVPFFRENVKQAGRKGAPPGSVRATHRITGGTANLKDTLANVLENIDRMVDLSVTNDARQKVAELAQEPGGGRFLAKIPPESKRLTVLTEEAKREFAKQKGLDFNDQAHRAVLDGIWEDVGPTLEVWQHGQAPKGDNLFAVMREGKPTYYEVGDPELLRALLAFNRPGTSAPWLASFKNIQQYTITRNPRFMLRNIGRDTIEAGIIGRYGFRPVLDTVRGMRSRISEDESYREFVAQGGGMGGLYSPEHVRSQLYSVAREGGVAPKHILDTPRKFKHFIDETSEAFELATRVGAYRRAREQGVSPQESAYEAREISTDFSMRGDAAALQFFLDTVPFFKAGLAGMHRVNRAMFSDPHRIQVGRRVGMLALASGAIAAHNYGNPLYENQSDVMKQTYWHFLVPTRNALLNASQRIGPTDAQLEHIIKHGSDKESREAFEELSSRYHHFTLPKNWEIGSIATLAELGVEAMLGNAPEEVATDAALAIIRNFHFSLIPGAIEPIAESVANTDFFTGAPIVPMSEEGKATGYQYTTRTPLVLRDIGEKTGASPIEMDHFLRSYFNAFATYGLMAADTLLYGDQAEAKPNPLVTSYYRTDASGSQPVRDLMDTYRELDAIHQTLGKLTKERDSERAKAFAVENLESLQQHARLQAPYRAVENLRSFENSVRGFRKLEDIQAAAEAWAEAQENPRLLENLKSGPWDAIGILKAALIEDVRRAKIRTATRARAASQEPRQ